MPSDPPSRPTDARIVLVTAPSEEVARQLAGTLVEERRIACANLVPGIRSIYRWEGAVEDAVETLMILKTTAATAVELTGRIVELHPYDVPEVLVLEVESGHGAYLDWIATEVTGA